MRRARRGTDCANLQRLPGQPRQHGWPQSVAPAGRSPRCVGLFHVKHPCGRGPLPSAELRSAADRARSRRGVSPSANCRAFAGWLRLAPSRERGLASAAWALTARSRCSASTRAGADRGAGRGAPRAAGAGTDWLSLDGAGASATQHSAPYGPDPTASPVEVPPEQVPSLNWSRNRQPPCDGSAHSGLSYGRSSPSRLDPQRLDRDGSGQDGPTNDGSTATAPPRRPDQRRLDQRRGPATFVRPPPTLQPPTDRPRRHRPWLRSRALSVESPAP